MRVFRLGLLALAGVLPSGTSAQRVALTPTVGAYFPLTDQARRTSSGGCPVSPSCLPEYTLSARLLPAATVGLRATVRLEAWLGIEASLAYAAPRRQVGVRWYANGPPDTLTHPSASAVAALRAQIWHRIGPRVGVGIAAGPAFTRLSGPSYALEEEGRPYPATATPWIVDRAVWGPSLSGSVALALTPRSRLEVTVTGWRYTLHSGYRPADSSEAPAFQVLDMAVVAGVTLGLGRPAARVDP